MADLSIIIPTLNAGEGLRHSLPPLAALDALPLVQEVIFADGGSTDETHEISKAAGARFVTTKRGRGQQLGAAAAAAKGRWLLFLHADTILAPKWNETVWEFTHGAGNNRRAGFFGFKLNDSKKRAKLLEGLVELRIALFGLPYGDQALLISREFYLEIGGFRPFPIMEDVDIVRRIGRRRMVRLPRNAVTSAERYQRDGYLWRPMRNLFCLSLYFLGVPPGFIVKLYG